MDASGLSPRGRSLAIALLIVATGLVGVALTAPRVAAAPPYAYGSLCNGSPSVTWLAGSTWILNKSAVVDDTCVLTIEPGVTVKADPGVHLYVNGTLIADGMPGDAIDFVNNQTTVTSWGGIQFDPGSAGSVSWSNFTRVQVAVTAKSSSPAINNNTILQAAGGLRLESSASLVADNEIDGHAIGSIGIILEASTATVERNSINGTVIGVQTLTSGSPRIIDNRLTNISGTYALAMFIDHQTSVNITGNSIQGVFAKDASPGSGGQTGAGILTNATATVVIRQNVFDTIRGGRGGDGANGGALAGSPGGSGGPAAGIAIGGAATVTLQGNTLTTIQGGRGGDGGSSSLLAGGYGGMGGLALGIELFSATGNVSFLGNTVMQATGGSGGTGGLGGSTAQDGRGGAGSDAYGIFSLGGQNASLSGNTISSLQAGSGGIATATPTTGGMGGAGGNATGVLAVINGNVTLHANGITSLLGGAGGDGYTLGGYGGNVSGLVAIGLTNRFNSTLVGSNIISALTGGTGGMGRTRSGEGGNVTGMMGMHVNTTLVSNRISGMHGGAGGVPYNPSNPGGGGGDAGAVALFDVPDGSSVRDSIQSVVGGGPGGAVSPRFGLGAGYYFVGNHTIQTRVQVTNATLASIANYTFYVDNYTTATALNVSFPWRQAAVMSAGNLTVRNFLAVQAFWPNNTTALWGDRVAVQDNGVEIYNQTSPFGSTRWIVATNRVYTDTPIPTWNATRVTVSYATYAFANNRRLVNLTSSQTQYFTMVDSAAPSSSALALPPWTTTRTFTVGFSSTDGFGVGIRNVTLWYRLNGTSWVNYGNQSLTILGFGAFSFTAPADGKYEFATTAIDKAGNLQVPSPPTANNTWTIVDTVAPSSHMLALPRYERSTSFAVSWAPGVGVTDVANYTVQVNTGSGWMAWLTNSTLTTATYTASVQGPVAFRTLARDLAGNAETKTVNDTWTVVDTVAPRATAWTPTGNMTVTPAAIMITFSEPMNDSATEAAFSLSPSVAGAFTWSNGSTTLTFRPAQSLAAGTTYTVTLGTGAMDLAGNSLAQVDVFSFNTPALAPSGFSLADLWPLLVVVAAALAALAFFLVRRRSSGQALEELAEPPKPAPAAAPSKSEAAIDDVFLLYRRDGVLIKHETRRLRPDIDTDILSGMLTAVQQFVKDSFHGEEGEELNEMTVGQMHILIGRGKWLVLAATITGGDIASMTAQIEKCVEDMETHNWDRLEEWDGDMDLAKALGPYLKRLIRGEYAA